MTGSFPLSQTIGQALLARNRAYQEFFDAEAPRIALACSRMAERFQSGGRLIAFGRGPYSTDAQHVSVEFIHPVIVGKRALPAIDASSFFSPFVSTMLQPEDIVMGFSQPEGDEEIARALALAQRRGAMTMALPGACCDYSVEKFDQHPFQHQEMIEILYHTLWESVHVYLEHRELDSPAGDAAFLYPFLGHSSGELSRLHETVAASIRVKVADDARLRAQVAEEQGERIAEAAIAIGDRIGSGCKLLLFGNGGSATDANDWAIDCVTPPSGMRAFPALSLSAEPAVITAIANDIGPDVVFLRQLIAHGRPGDVAIGISTSGGSRNLLAAFEEARRRKMVTVALLGYDGGEVLRSGLADFPIVVRCDYIPRIQEVQASIYHVIRELLEVTTHA